MGRVVGVKKLDAPPSQTAIVGDQLFADVMAGRLAGVRSILVDPIHPEEEPWWTRHETLARAGHARGEKA